MIASVCDANTLDCYINTSVCDANTLSCYINTSPCYVNTSGCYINTPLCYANTSGCYINASPCNRIASLYNEIGIAKQIEKCLLEPLFTTKSIGKGTRLGLSIVRQIVVEKYNGNVTVNFQPV